MSDVTFEPLETAVMIAVDAGLRWVRTDRHRPWSRLTCPSCGGSLDVPIGVEFSDSGSPCHCDLSSEQIHADHVARRINAFVYRHRPGKVHR